MSLLTNVRPSFETAEVFFTSAVFSCLRTSPIRRMRGNLCRTRDLDRKSKSPLSNWILDSRRKHFEFFAVFFVARIVTADFGPKGGGMVHMVEMGEFMQDYIIA